MPLKKELDEADKALKKTEREVQRLVNLGSEHFRKPEFQIAYLQAQIDFIRADSHLQDIFHEALEERVQVLENMLRSLSKPPGRGPKKPSGPSSPRRDRRR